MKMASGPRISEWRKLPLSLTELCIDTTLRCGQAFRWRKIDDEWFVYLYHLYASFYASMLGCETN